MTLSSVAKAFHYNQLDLLKIKKIDDAKGKFHLIVADAMKAYYSLKKKDTWKELAESIVQRYIKYLSKDGGILILVADLYKTPNLLRKVMATKKQQHASTKKEKEDGEEPTPVKISDFIVDPSSLSAYDLSTPPGGTTENEVSFESYLRDYRWRNDVFLPKIGEELRKMRLSNITLVIRGFCEEPEQLRDPRAFNKLVSHGIVYLCPCEEDTDMQSGPTAAFDYISCVASSEADCAGFSMAVALCGGGTDGNNTSRAAALKQKNLIGRLTETREFQSALGAKRPSNVLHLTGDGDGHTVDMMGCYLRSVTNLFLGVFDLQWTLPFVYNCHEAATAIGSSNHIFGNIYNYCSMIYISGCDYNEGISGLDITHLEKNIRDYFRADPSMILRNLGFTGGEERSIEHTLSKWIDLSRPDIYMRRELVKLDLIPMAPRLGIVTWMGLILWTKKIKLSSCKCPDDYVGICSTLHRTKGGSNTHITMHELLGCILSLNTTMTYFLLEPYPESTLAFRNNLGPLSGFYVDKGDNNRVKFGIKKPTAAFEELDDLFSSS